MRKYDFIFGAGYTCKCTMALREAGLQFASFPMDWSPGCDDWVRRAEIICNGFDGWMDPQYLEAVPSPKDSFFAYYREHKYGFLFIHDFSKNVPFEEDLKVVRARHARRVARFLELIERSKRVLVLWINTPIAQRKTAEDALEFARVMNQKYPDIRFDMLIFDYAEGVPLRKIRDHEEGPVRVVSFDYRNYKDSDWAVDQFIVAKWLKTQYQIDDYRTPEEKAEWERKVAAHKWGRYNAKTFWQYLVNKFSYKLYVHLRKRLEKEGII